MAESADSNFSEAPHMKPQDKSEYIKVVVRCRPPNEREIHGGHESVVEVDTKQGLVELQTPITEKTQAKKSFTFERTYDRFSKQSDLYDETFRDIVDGVLQGYNGTIFAYGQTGAGKTFTMQGVKDNNYPELQGIIPRSAEHIFQHIAQSQDQQYLIRCSYVQIYQEEICDLLKEETPSLVHLKESPDTGVYMKDVSTFIVTSLKEVARVLKKGITTTSVWATNMGVYSTRVTYIFTITVEHNEIGEDGERHNLVGQLNFVDMAGSERPPKSAVTVQNRQEGASIGMSLAPFGQGAVQREYKNWLSVQSLQNVITALDNIDRGKSSMIPYRESKLSRLLQDSLGGTAKTVMVACIGPASCNYDETLRTLRYAERAKNVKNRPKINRDPKLSLLQEYLREIERLKAQLADMTIEKQNSDQQEEKGQEKCDLNQENASLKDDVCSDQILSQQEKDRKWSENEEKVETVLEKETETIDTLEANIRKMEAKLLTGRESAVRDSRELKTALSEGNSTQDTSSDHSSSTALEENSAMIT